MEILDFNQDYIVCIKPVGLDSEKQTIEKLQEQYPGEYYPVHRLDLNVSGVMVFARTKAMAAQLSKAIQEGAMIKEYVAMVHGIPAQSGDWTDLLFKDSRKNKVFVVKRKRNGVKEARLTFTTLKVWETTSLVHIRLYTGRTHQIRVQFSSRGYPLIGDHKYGSKSEETAPKLYSCRLTFPYHGKEVVYKHYPDWYQI